MQRNCEHPVLMITRRPRRTVMPGPARLHAPVHAGEPARRSVDLLEARERRVKRRHADSAHKVARALLAQAVVREAEEQRAPQRVGRTRSNLPRCARVSLSGAPQF